MAAAQHETPAEIHQKLIAPKSDGTPITTRPEMEQRLNDVAPTVHQKRLQAIHLGLDTRVALDMKPVTVRHWVLDELIRKKVIQGEILDISSDLGADHIPEHFQQFLQKLGLFIEKGWALDPLPGEVPMSNQLVPPPPVPGQPPAPPSDGQNAPAFTPPPMPPGVAPAAPQAPMIPQPLQAAPLPPPVAPTAPPVPASIPAPGQPPQPQVPQQAVPVPAQEAPKLGVLIKAEPARPWGKPSPSRPDAKRRTKVEIMEDKAWMSSGSPGTVATMTVEEAQAAGYQVNDEMVIVGAQNPPPQAAPQAPTTPPFPQSPTQGPSLPQPVTAPPMAPPSLPTIAAGMPVAPAQAPNAQTVSGNDTLQRNQENLAKQMVAIKHQLKVLDTALALMLRQTFQRQGEFKCEEALKELGVQLPS